MYFQYTTEIACSIKRNSVHLDLRFTDQYELNFSYDNDNNTQDNTQVNNWATQT
jgi:hypothetical protein